MTVLEGFGLRLIPPDSDTAELIRLWRNAPEISRYMEFREYITSEMQRQWLSSLPEKPVKYFVIFAAERPAGLIYLKNIERETAEAGLFLGDAEMRGTGAALGASVLLLDYAFDNLGLTMVWAKVMENNDAARHYNSGLGFKPVQNLGNGFQRWELEVSDYLWRRKFLVSLIKSLGV